MQKRKLWWFSSTLLFVIAGGLTALGAVLKHEPSFYRAGQVTEAEARKEFALICLKEFGQMMYDIQKTKREKWGCEVTEPQLNCFFEEIFARSGEAESLGKLGISGLNVAFQDDDHLRLAFRYGSGSFSTVLSYELKIWLVPQENNVIAVQVLRARAGALPISSQSVLQQLSEFARGQNYKVTLYRHESCPVAVIELQPYQPHPEGVLTKLSVDQGKLSIRGKTLEHALLPPPVNSRVPASK
jgi:hypothetical protein